MILPRGFDTGAGLFVLCELPGSKDRRCDQQNTFAAFIHGESIAHDLRFVFAVEYNFSMNRCWARSLGNCSDKMSKEHTVTAGLFPDSVIVQGFSWCKVEPKKIGLAGLTKKILCTTDNSNLSPVDNAAIDAFKVFQESVRLTSVREKMNERRWKVSRMLIDGLALERWFLKTLINAAFDGEQKIGPKASP